SWMFLYEAYQQIGVSIASLAYYCGPVIVMAFSPWLFNERFTLPKVAGFIAVLCGILLINIQAIHDGKTGWGLFCGVMSAVMYAFMVIFNKKAHSITGMRNSMLQLTISFLTVAIFIGFRQGFIIHISLGDWIPIFILGLLNTGIGCYLYFSSIGNLPVQTVAIFGYLEPLSAVVFSVLFLREILLPVQVLGAVLVIGGAVSAEGIYKRRKSD
ncbi:MAG: rhtA 2, partial [Clostridia bacterium]|nr:rhtA 2 [Clostridia bacterium]